MIVDKTMAKEIAAFIAKKGEKVFEIGQVIKGSGKVIVE
jgi:phosphoribosylaminoimidazole (AIR) synthetase